jgi:NADH:ubiquinone oxidoreductase subunit 6 (subunit J)
MSGRDLSVLREGEQRCAEISEVNMESIKTRLMREAVTCSVYFVISILSAILAYDRFVVASGEDIKGVEINAAGMARIMWGDYLVPFIYAFAVLCALRFLSIILLWYARKRTVYSNQVQ